MALGEVSELASNAAKHSWLFISQPTSKAMKLELIIPSEIFQATVTRLKLVHDAVSLEIHCLVIEGILHYPGRSFDPVSSFRRLKFYELLRIASISTINHKSCCYCKVTNSLLT